MDLSAEPEYLKLVNLLHRLEMKSHTSALVIDADRVSGGSGTTGNRPPGGAERKDDREPEYWLRSVTHYRRRLTGARSVKAIILITADVERTLKAWEKAPLPSGIKMNTPFTKLQIAESRESAGEIARKVGCSRQYVYRVRSQYRRDEAA